MGGETCNVCSVGLQVPGAKVVNYVAVVVTKRVFV